MTEELRRAPQMPQNLGQMRTVMAADRTLMAWIRTALSMLSFGFTIYKILEAYQEATRELNPHLPRNAGLFLVGMGVGSLLLGIYEHRSTLRSLHHVDNFQLRRPAFIVASLLAMAGIGLFVAISFELF